MACLDSSLGRAGTTSSGGGQRDAAPLVAGCRGASGRRRQSAHLNRLPTEHWTRIYSTNPLDRLNREVKRRTNLVGIFPDSEAVIRLVGSVPIETNDEWQAGHRYYNQASMRKLHQPLESLATSPSLSQQHPFTERKESCISLTPMTSTRFCTTW